MRRLIIMAALMVPMLTLGCPEFFAPYTASHASPTDVTAKDPCQVVYDVAYEIHTHKLAHLSSPNIVAILNEYLRGRNLDWKAQYSGMLHRELIHFLIPDCQLLVGVRRNACRSNVFANEEYLKCADNFLEGE